MNLTKKLFLAGAIMLFILPGCNNEEMVSLDNHVLKVRLMDVQPATRTSFDSYEGKIAWNVGDEIAIYSSGGLSEGYLVGSVVPDNLALTGSVSIDGKNHRDCFAVSPASLAVVSDYGNPYLKINLPDHYDISDIVMQTSPLKTSDFSPVPMIAVNDGSVNTLAFYHVGGLLRITLGGLLPQTKTVSVTLDKDITGEYLVSDPATDHPTITTRGTSSSNTITFVLAETEIGPSVSTIVLNVPVPCGTYDWVRVETFDGQSGQLSSQVYDSHSLSFLRHRGKRVSFGDLTFVPVLDPAIPDIVSPTPSDYSDDIVITVNEVSGTEIIGSDSWMAFFTDTEPSVGELVSESWSRTPLQDDYGNDWLSLSAYEGNGDANEVTVNMTAATYSTQPICDWMVNAARIRNELMEGNGVTDLDLSRYDIITDATDGNCETANCYVIKTYGSYLIPCVYGNAICDGAINKDAYSTTVSGEYPGYGRNESSTFSVLNSFVNADGRAIGNPVIPRDPNLTLSSHLKAFVLWQDVLHPFEILTDDDVEYVPSDGTAANCPYIRVKFDRDRIAPGNIVVALFDEDNEKILWSWHLWVTSDELQTVAVKQFDDHTINKFLNCPIGWVPPVSYSGGITAERSQYVVIVSKTNMSVLGTFNVLQRSKRESGLRRNQYSATQYQYGRKDPFCSEQRAIWTSDYITSNRGYYSMSNYGLINSTRLQETINFPWKVYNGKDTNYLNLWDTDCGGTSVADSPVKKSVYDPSPRGFNVPNLLAFSGLFRVRPWGFVNSFLKDQMIYYLYPDEWSDYINAKMNVSSGDPEKSIWLSMTTEHSSDEATFTFNLYYTRGFYYDNEDRWFQDFGYFLAQRSINTEHSNGLYPSALSYIHWNSSFYDIGIDEMIGHSGTIYPISYDVEYLAP